MKCNKKPFNNRYASANITGIIEVLIPLCLWKRIQKIQELNPTLTYSWITRYALARLLRHTRRSHFLQNAKLQRLRAEDKQIAKARTQCHRHSMCLYGDDEEKLKQISLQLRISISTLTRIALLWYLHELEKKEIPASCDCKARSYKRFGRLSLQKILYVGTKIIREQDVWQRYGNFTVIKTLHRAKLFKEDEFWLGMLGQDIQTIE